VGFGGGGVVVLCVVCLLCRGWLVFILCFCGCVFCGVVGRFMVSLCVGFVLWVF